MRNSRFNNSILNKTLKLFIPKQNVSISPSPFKIGRVLRITSILIISVSILYNNVFAVSPSVDGRFYGDGDDARYTLMGVNSNGWGNLYTRMENDNVYVALVVDRSANDTVIGQWNPNPSDRDYLNSAGWNNRSAAQLINSEFAEFTFTICEGAGAPYEATYTWQQAFGYDSDGDENPSEADWVSDNLQAPGLGIAPPGMVSASSITWNLNNYALAGSPSWDVTLGGTKSGTSEWKSPYVDPDTVIGVSGYPAIGDITFDTDHGWEWPMVYEWAVPLDDYIDNCSGYPLFVVSGTSHHSPSKVGEENIPIDEIVVPEFIEFGDLPDTYGTLLASDGARHNIPIGSAYLGISVDPESDGQPNVGALGDDNSGDDEDGIVFLTPLTPGTQAQIQVTAGTAGYLSVFIDFDNDGTLDAVSLDSATGPAAVATGTISDTHLSAAGIYIFTITVPADAANTIYSRFRFTTNSGDGGASATGLATTGEVEDYVLVSEAEESASLTIEKSTNTEDADEIPGPSIAVGGTVNWSYVVENTGNVTLTNVTVTDNQIADDTTIDCGGAAGTENVIASLLPGSDNKVTCTATGTATLGQYSNIGTASTTYDSDPVSDTDPSHYFGLSPSMSIEKTVTDVDGESSSSVVNEVGDVISYQVVLTNDGNQDLTNITLGDSLVTVVGTEIESITNDDVLEVGETWTYTYTYIVLQADIDDNGGGDGDIDNTATGDSDETDPPVDSSVEVPIEIYALSIEKTVTEVDGDTTTPFDAVNEVGDEISYQVVLTNDGNQDLTNITLDDSLVTVVSTETESITNDDVLEVGETWTYTYTYTVLQADLDNNGGGDGDIDNTATGDSDETDPPVDSSVEVPIEYYAMSIEKTVTDVDEDGDGSSSVDEAGDVISYQVVLTNDGNTELTSITLSDTLVPLVGTPVQSDTTNAVMEVGETWTYTYTYIVLQADLDNNGGGDGDIDNTATGDSAETESVDSSADVPIVAYSLGIEKTTSTTPVTPTGNVTYIIKVENTGTELLTNVQVTDDLDATFGAGKYSVSSTSVSSGLTKNASFDGTIDKNLLAGTDSLANGESGTITVNLTLNNPSTGTHTNTAVADSDETGSVNDTADVLVETYLLEVTKTTSTTPVSPSGNVTYTIKVENIGTGDITNLQVTDNLDDTFGAGKYSVTSTSVDSGLTKNGSFDGTSDTKLLDGTDTLLAGTSKNITVNLTLVNASLGTHTNTAVADSDETPSDNDTADVVVETFTVMKDFVAGDYSNHAGTTNPEVTIGEMIQYQVEVTFLGGRFADVLIVDTLDLGLAFVQCDSFSIGTLTVDASNCTSPSITPAVGAGELAATSISWDLGDVVSTGLSTDKIILTYTVVVLNNSANVRDLSLNNNVVVTSTSSTASNVATAPLVTIVEPTLQIQKSVDKESVLPGDIVTYMIEISHAAISNSHAYDVIIKDVIPAGITYVPNSLFHLSGQAPGGSECGNAFNEIDPIAGLEICYDVLLDNHISSVITFQALVGLSFEGEIDNIASVEWTSLPGDLSAPQTPNNDLSTERWYDPGDNVNIYGGIDDNAIITTLGEEEVTLPASGFTPGVTTELGDRPNSSLYVQSGMTLVIPKIDVSTKIVGVPFGDTGWNVDWLGSQTGYLHGTSFPTYAGNTVLTSHFVDANGLPGPFAELKQLSWGDKINIYANGSKYVYQVVNTMIVSADNLSILNHKVNDWVTLFTCSNYNLLTDEYDNRFAVQAVLISIE